MFEARFPRNLLVFFGMIAAGPGCARDVHAAETSTNPTHFQIVILARGIPEW